MDLTQPLPWQIYEEPTEEQLEREYGGFAALLASQGGDA